MRKLGIDKLLVLTTGVYTLENPRDRKVYIGYSNSDVLTHIAGIVRELRMAGFKVPEMNKDRWELEFNLVEQGTDIETLRLHVRYWEDLYVEQGWTLYNPAKRKYLENIVELIIPHNLSTVDVLLQSSKGINGRIVGKFSNRIEAEAFIEACYSEATNPYMYPVYAANSLTREFILSHIQGLL